MVFNDIKWTRHKLMQNIWLSLIDYGRLERDNAKQMDEKRIREVWCKNELFANMIHGWPRWKFTCPDNSFNVH
jgi:hypothetical protein